MPIPDATPFIAHYPQGEAAMVKKQIGGKVHAEWITNTCAIRLSRAFNKAGVLIPKGYPGLSTVTGGDGLQYAFRVAEMKKWIESRYGAPTLRARGPMAAAPASFKDKKGVICFIDCGWSDATGHLDLWDGTKVVGHPYFEVANEVVLWAAPARTVGATTAGAAATAAATAAAPRPSKPGKVTVDVANVRSLPNTTSAIVGKLQRNAPVQVLGTQAGFYQIGQNRWVHASLVTVA